MGLFLKPHNRFIGISHAGFCPEYKFNKIINTHAHTLVCTDLVVAYLLNNKYKHMYVTHRSFQVFQVNVVSYDN